MKCIDKIKENTHMIPYLSKVEMKCIDKIKENTHTHTRRKNYYRIKMKK